MYGALAPEHVAIIRQNVENAAGLSAAEVAAKAALAELEGKLPGAVNLGNPTGNRNNRNFLVPTEAAPMRSMQLGIRYTF